MSVKEVFGAPVAAFGNAVKQRWDHPVGGPFLFIWLVWNHKLLMVLFASGSFQEKWTFLEQKYPHTWEAAFLHLGMPLILTLLYLGIAPFAIPLQTLMGVVAEYLDGLMKRIFRSARLYTAGEYDALENRLLSEAKTAVDEEKQRTSAREAELAAIAGLLQSTQGIAKDMFTRRVNAEADRIGLTPGEGTRYPMQVDLSLGDHPLAGPIRSMGISPVAVHALKTLSERNSLTEKQLLEELPIKKGYGPFEISLLIKYEAIDVEWQAETAAPLLRLTNGGARWLKAFREVPEFSQIFRPNSQASR